MKSWVEARGRAVGRMWGKNREWWWHRRLRIADWLYAVLPLPFSGLLQLIGGLQIGLLSKLLPGFSSVLNTGDLLNRANPLVLMLLGVTLGIVVPVLWAGLTVLLRRTDPRWLLLTSLALLLLFANFVPAMIALYSYAVYHANRRVLVGSFALYSLAMILVYGGGLFAQMFLIGIVLLVPMTFGLWVGTRRQLMDRLQERAERLEREQHMLAEQAITTERTRIAREMHDVVAHRVSLMVLHAGGLEVSAEDERTVEVAGLIRTTGREALAELRGILGVLRDDSTAAPTAPQPVLADLDRLLEEWRTAGMPIQRQETGHVRPLPTGVQRTAYRIVQEGLTNAAKHAPGSEVTLLLHYGKEQLELEVANAPSQGAVAPMPRSGFGLTGLHERVVLAGGTLSAGQCPDGGWRLRAILRMETDTDTDHQTDTPSGTEEAPDVDPHAPGR